MSEKKGRRREREGDKAHSLRPPFSKESTRRVITKRKIRNGGAADDAVAIAALDGWPIEHTARPADGRTGMAHIIWAEREDMLGVTGVDLG